MDYRLENLSEDDFEKIINTLCQKVLGTGTVSFSKGKDGGRDGRFEGKANNFPSFVECWEGKFIIQSKHSSSYQSSCSDKSFFGNKESIVKKEIEKIISLKNNNEVDNYLLFTNRKETASREKAKKHIRQETGLINVDIIGKETLHTWLDQHNDIVKTFKIGIYSLPLVLTEFDIKNVILEFGKQTKVISTITSITEQDLTRNILKEKKNTLNNLSENYYKNQIKAKSLQNFILIDDLLQRDEELANIYYNFAFELSNKIEIKREHFDKFEEIFEYLYTIIFESNQIELNKDRRLIWLFLHHLYFNCHIGRTE